MCCVLALGLSHIPLIVVSPPSLFALSLSLPLSLPLTLSNVAKLWSSLDISAHRKSHAMQNVRRSDRKVHNQEYKNTMLSLMHIY